MIVVLRVHVVEAFVGVGGVDEIETLLQSPRRLELILLLGNLCRECPAELADRRNVGLCCGVLDEFVLRGDQ